VLKVSSCSLAFIALCAAHLLAKDIKQAREPQQTRASDPIFVGSAGCKSSSCHGGAGEKRSQYITWSQRDFHTRAHAILLDARSARIGESIGIPEPQSSARCTVCHSPLQPLPQTRLAVTARPDEGVSCENCHGAAGGWLRGHTRADWTYAMRVSAGMHDLRNLYVRANGCVACHQNVDADLLGAGHPTLVFELDSQSVNEPKHWRDDDSWSGARAWLVGQAVALRETAWRSRADSNPAADAQQTAGALAWLLQKVTLTEPLFPKVVESSTSDLGLLEQQADDLARRAANWNPSTDSSTSLLRTLADTGSEFTVANDRSLEKLFYRARRLVLGVDSLTNSVNANRSTPLQLDQELSALRADVQKHYDFDVAKFAEHLRALRAKL
jgi:Cytochrome c554 and c-prime